MTPQEMRAVIAVGAYRVLYDTGPSAEWLSDRMDWTGRQGEHELGRMRYRGLVTFTADLASVAATPEAVTEALALWRASKLEQAA